LFSLRQDLPIRDFMASSYVSEVQLVMYGVIAEIVAYAPAKPHVQRLRVVCALF